MHLQQLQGKAHEGGGKCLGGGGSFWQLCLGQPHERDLQHAPQLQEQAWKLHHCFCLLAHLQVGTQVLKLYATLRPD